MKTDGHGFPEEEGEICKYCGGFVELEILVSSSEYKNNQMGYVCKKCGSG